MRRSIGICVFAAVVAVGTGARATSGEPTVGLAGAAGPAPPAPAPTVSDHASVVGRWGVGLQSVALLPIAGPCCDATNAGPQLETINAPIIGVRHWVRRTLGVDLGIGIGVHTALNEASSYGFALHGGLPIVIGQGRYTAFEVTPEGTLGFAFGSNPAALPPVGGSATVNGFLLRVGARAGTEVHFGFIGLPELALQASVGLYWLGESYNLDVNGLRIGSRFMTLTTSVNGNPWDIFSESVAALYYF
jgi:hypothetical protein